MIVRSMRFRLTALFVILFAIAQLALWLFVERIRTKYVLNEYDRQLVSRANDMLTTVKQVITRPAGDDTRQTLDRLFTRGYSRGFFFQLRRADGETVMASKNLIGFDLPFSIKDKLKDPPVPFEVFETIDDWQDDAIHDSVFGGRSTIRLVTVRDGPHGDDTFYLQAAVDLQPVLQNLQTSRQLLLVFGVVSVLLGGLATWLITGRSLAPLRGLTRVAERISGTRLRERGQPGPINNEVGAAIKAVNEMLDRLEKEFSDLDRFVTDISHELKTPLVVMLGEARDLIRSCEVEGHTYALANLVRQETSRMLRTIESFLILARARANVKLPVSAGVSLEEVAAESIRAARKMAEDKDIRIIMQFDESGESIEPHIAGDHDLLRSMLDNLIQNSIRHSSAGTNVIITVGSRRKTNQAILKIRDNGPGISEIQMDMIFNRYYQDQSAKRTGQAGLGLAIVKAVVDLHEGDISVKNLVDSGCEFEVLLPLADDSTEPGPSQPTVNKLRRAKGKRRLKARPRDNNPRT